MLAFIRLFTAKILLKLIGFGKIRLCDKHTRGGGVWIITFTNSLVFDEAGIEISKALA